MARLLFVLYLSILLLAACSAQSSATSREPKEKSYSSPRYEVSLKYPAAWQKVSGYDDEFRGEDGFFALSAANGGSSMIDEAAKLSIEHKHRPYGSHPTVESWLIQGREARLIRPSDDAEMAGHAELIVQQPVTIDGDTYRYFVLWASQEHIAAIAQTLQFGTSPATGTPLTKPLSSPSVIVVPTLTPETHSGRYEDRYFCLSAELPAGWWFDSSPGTQAHFRPPTKEPSFTSFTITSGFETLPEALRTVEEGSLGPHIQEVKEFTVDGEPALWLTFDNPESSGIKLLALVITPDCGDGASTLFISARRNDQELFESFLSYITFIRAQPEP